MAFTNYTIVPVDGVVVIDGQAAHGVGMAGIPANVHAIQWYGIRSAGVIEYVGDPLTGQLPPQGSFTDPATYSTQTDEAEAIIFAANNPETYYSTADQNTYEGVTYSLGAPIVIDTPDTPQPPETTVTVPPTPEPWETLYWYNSAWVVSSVDPTLSLASAKSALISEVNISAATAGTYQARAYSTVQLFDAADVSALDTADYFSVTLGDYQTYLDGQVVSLTATINAATTVPALYGVNPNVEPNPNP